MHSLTEGDLTFGFQSTGHVTKYDDWSFYRNRLQKMCGGSKAVDILAFDPNDGPLWMIEVKDYRAHRRAEEKGDLVLEIAYKMRDTLVASGRGGGYRRRRLGLLNRAARLALTSSGLKRAGSTDRSTSASSSSRSPAFVHRSTRLL